MTHDEGTTQGTSRGRVAAALCTAGVVAVALGGNLLGAGADNPPVIPGEPVGSAPTKVAPDAAGAPGAGATSSAAAEPGGGAAGRSTTDSSDSATTTTETTTTPAPSPTETIPAPAPSAPPAAPTRDSAAPAPEQAPPPLEPARPAAPAQPALPAPRTAAPPIGQLAGPTADDRTAKCLAADAEGAGADKATLKAGSATILEQPKLATRACKPKSLGSENTASPDRRDMPRDKPAPAALRSDSGVPTTTNPTASLALPGAVPVGVPNFFIDKFRIPPFLLPIYQAAGMQYGIRWEVLAAINEIETDYGRNLNVSSAGALGWMQFMPATWKSFGTDANRDGRKDPFNPVDAIFAAARYLRAAGATRTCARGSSPTTTPTGTSNPCSCAHSSSVVCRTISSAR
jgi:hypothetical protein